MMAHVPGILLAEDNPNDVELTIEALDQHNLANRVVVAHDGVEALEYLRLSLIHISEPTRPY